MDWEKLMDRMELEKTRDEHIASSLKEHSSEDSFGRLPEDFYDESDNGSEEGISFIEEPDFTEIDGLSCDCNLDMDELANNLAKLKLESAKKAAVTSKLVKVNPIRAPDMNMSIDSYLSLDHLGDVGDNIENPDEESLSPRSSHTEDMVHKISIYSKVSGCRMSNLTEQIIIKQLRVVILEKLVNGDYNQVGFYRFAFEKLKNGGLQVISSDKNLIEAIGRLKYFAGIPVKMTFPDTPRVVGFIRNLPVNIEPSELKETIRESIPEVYSVRYVTERILGEGLRKSPCAFVSFNLRFLPLKVTLFGKEYELHVPNPMQCSRCCRYGHQGKQCRAQVRCLYCSESHSKFQCRSPAQVCVNCKEAHPANSHDCIVWQQGKMMNELRYRGGYSAEEAMSIASNGKIPLKKHNFICVEYFENQDAFFFEGLSDESYGSDELKTETTSGKTTYHPRALQVQPFLDLLSEFYLRLVNYPYGGRPLCREEVGKKPPRESSDAAKQLKKTILSKLNQED